MHRTLAIVVIAVTVAVGLPAFAELQNVQVGGSIRIRGNYWTSPAGPDSATARNPLFQWPLTPSFAGVGGNPLRFLRWGAQPGRLQVTSPVDWNDSGHGMKIVEQRTKINVKADFSDQVSAFIELDSYDWWGRDFRSNYLTGIDGPANTADDVEVYQAYVEANEMFGYPLRLRIGRQELKFGSGWLLGTNDAGSWFRGLSYDAIRATYATDVFSLDAVAAKLREVGPVEEDGDVDMYVLYGSYLGLEDITLDAYWILVRDARSQGVDRDGLSRANDTNLGLIGEWVEDVLGVDDYDVTNLHTVGLRGAGALGAFKVEAEAAYQFGDASAVGRQFAGAALISGSPYGDDDAEFDEWAANVQVAYAFDTDYAPSVFLGGSYYGGEDNRDITFWEWIAANWCPFWSADASMGFNRLFSDWQYGQFVASDNHDCTNLWLVYGGISVMPTESLTAVLSAAYVSSLDDYDITWPVFWILGNRITPLAQYSWISQTNDDHLCTELMLSLTYNYSEDLTFEAGYSHLFLGDGAAAGNFNLRNGLGFEGGTGDDDADYFYLETKLCF